MVGYATNIHYPHDDVKGGIRRYYLSGGTIIYVDTSACTVDYATENVSVNAISTDSTVNVNSTIACTLIANSSDVVATRGILVDISASDISVKGEVDTIASGESSAGVGFNSTSTSTY